MFCTGTLFPPIEIYKKNKLFPWHSTNPLQLRYAIEGLQIFKEHISKFLSPDFYGGKSHLNNVIELPYSEGSVSFGYCTADTCETQNQNTS